MTVKKNAMQAMSLSKVFTFSTSKQPIRVEVFNQQPYFVAKDVCDVLSISNNRDAVKNLDEDEKLMSAVPTLGVNRGLWFVNESGLYNLIFQSRKPEAKAFRKWVTSEVLPSLRKNGFYSINQKSKTNYVDARNVPYHTVELNGNAVRCLQLSGTAWYSLNDVNKAMDSSTESTQCARKLNAVDINAQKIFIFGNTHPAWFVTEIGVQLLLSGSRKLRAPESLQLALNFTEKGGHTA